MEKNKFKAVGTAAVLRFEKWRRHISNAMAPGITDSATSNAPEQSKTGAPDSTSATDSTRTSAAATAVFMTTELLERILSFLPMKDLLLDQRVCSKWLKVIESSPELQQNLFFQPREAQFQWVECYNENGDFDGIKPVPKDYRSERPTPYPSGELNPLFFYQDKEQSDLVRNMFDSENVQCFELRQPLPTSPGSWQRMFISQPPAKTWGYYYHCWCPSCVCECGCGTGSTGDKEFCENRNMTINELRAKMAENHGGQEIALPDHISLRTVGVLYPNEETLKHHGMI